MKNGIISFCILFCGINLCFGQTKKIAHRSHSGKNASFTADYGNDNFGIDPRHMHLFDSIENAHLDSIAKADSIAKVNAEKKKAAEKKQPVKAKSKAKSSATKPKSIKPVSKK